MTYNAQRYLYQIRNLIIDVNPVTGIIQNLNIYISFTFQVRFHR